LAVRIDVSLAEAVCVELSPDSVSPEVAAAAVLRNPRLSMRSSLTGIGEKTDGKKKPTGGVPPVVNGGRLLRFP
jgi:hypothetical protein